MANDFVNMNQIAVFKNTKVLIEFNDSFKRAQLTSEDLKALERANTIEETPRKQFSKIHDKYSGITVVANDYSNGKGDKLLSLKLRLTAENAKLIYGKIKEKNRERRELMTSLTNEMEAHKQAATFFKGKMDEVIEKLKNTELSEEDKQKLNTQLDGFKVSFGTAQANFYSVKKRIEIENEYVETIFNEQKIAPSLIDNTQYSKVTVFNIQYNAKMKNPWTILVENGKGIKEQTSTGGSKIKNGTYIDRHYIKLFLVPDEIERIFQKVVDYTVEWETININPCLKERAMVENKESSIRFQNPS